MSRPLRVLVVEDEFLIADYIAMAIEDAGHQVVGMCDCADAAFECLLQDKPDLAILDIRINGDLDGVDLALRMQSEGIAAHHIFISGSGDPETKARAEATRPLAFLQKPVNSRQLEAVLALIPVEPGSSTL